MMKYFCDLCGKEVDGARGLEFTRPLGANRRLSAGVVVQLQDKTKTPGDWCVDTDGDLCLACLSKLAQEDVGKFEIVGGVDIPAMGKMHPFQYKRHLQGDGGFYVDHHDVLRSNATGRPLAVTEQQYRIFMEELTKELRQSEMWNE